MSVWATSQICREAEQARESREAQILQQQALVRRRNLKAWQSNGLRLEGGGDRRNGVLRIERRESRLPKTATLSHLAMLALNTTGFTTVEDVEKVVGAQMRQVLRHLHERGLADRGDFRNARNQLSYRYRLSPRGAQLVKSL